MKRSAIITCFAILLLLASGSARADDEPLDVDKVLKKVDKAIFFHDQQEKLTGYSAQLSTWQGNAKPDPAQVKKLEAIRLEVAKNKKTPASFTPGCGPWTLTALMSFELELFARPFSKQFSKEAFDRSVKENDTGYVLNLTPKKPIGGKGAPLKPTILAIQFTLDKKAVPQQATLVLDMEMSRTKGTLKFEYTNLKNQKRIKKIKNQLGMFNLNISPVLEFKFAKQSEFMLPERVDFRVSGGQLSGTLAGGKFTTYLSYHDYKIEKSD